MNSSDLGRGGMCVICCLLPVLICFQHRKVYSVSFPLKSPKQHYLWKKDLPRPKLKKPLRILFILMTYPYEKHGKVWSLHGRCGRDAANEQIVGYAINWLQRYNTLFFVDKQAWRVRWRKRRKNPRPAVKVRFCFCYSGGRSSNFVEFHIGKCQFKDKGSVEVNFAVHVCSKCDSLVYVYSNFWEEKCV